MNAHVHEFSWKLEASPEESFKALTNAGALKQWFAEHVEIERQDGGAFKFWGKHTLETPSKAKATQKIIAFEPQRRFGFSWLLLGVESEVSMTLEKNEGEKGESGTIVTGRHAFKEMPDVVRAKELIEDLWRLQHGNLVAFLNGGEEILLPDYDDPNPEIRLSTIIDAPRAEVFKALITPELLAKWMWAEKAVVEPKNGGAYTYGWNYKIDGKDVAGGPTKILDYVENEKLVTDWPDWRGDASVPVQTVTWLLDDAGSGKTRVTVVHSGFVRTVDFSDYPFGWVGFLAQMKDVVENG